MEGVHTQTQPQATLNQTQSTEMPSSGIKVLRLRLSNMSRIITVFAALIAFSSIGASASPVQAASSPEGSQLLELFTSQGCSSCPPAEKWIGQITTHRDLWKRFVPVVYHVDYWDRLGWRDPFAQKAHTERQYQYAAFHQRRSVYTPGFFVDGKEWRGFFHQGTLPGPRQNTPSIKAEWDAGELRITSELPSDKVRFHATVLGFGLQTSVKRGENSGRKLAGNFVVLSHKTADSEAQKQHEVTIQFSDKDLASKAPRYGFAVWAQNVDSPIPLTAAGNWLPKRLFVSRP